MATQKPIIHIFKEINKGKYKSTKHFELVQVTNGNTRLSEKINLSKNQNYARSMPEYWLRIRQGKKWSRYITGLFKTFKPGIFKGDSRRRQNLLLFDYPDRTEIITIYFFPDYFTNEINNVMHYIKN